MTMHRRDWLRWAALGLLSEGAGVLGGARAVARSEGSLTITGLKVTPIALPDPPLLFMGGCHGPYFLRNVVELETDAGIVGIGETKGGVEATAALERARKLDRRAERVRLSRVRPRAAGAVAGVLPGRSSWRASTPAARRRGGGSASCWAGRSAIRSSSRRICSTATRPITRWCWPTRTWSPAIRRGTGDRALDAWGEVRTPEAMAAMAEAFQERWGFRVFKLKGGVLAPDAERATLAAMAARLKPGCKLRIDPNGRWRVETAIRIGKTIARAAAWNTTRTPSAARRRWPRSARRPG